MTRQRATVFVMVVAAGWATACNPFSPDDSRSSPKNPANEIPDAGEADDGATVEPSAITCAPGTFVTGARTCSECAAGTYSTVTNATSCTPWTACRTGDIEKIPGSSTTDRTCESPPWTRQFGSDKGDGAFSVAVDESGNVYVVGNTDGTLPSQASAGAGGTFVRKYDGAGKELWTRQFGVAGAAGGGAQGVAVDATGSVYVVGDTTGALPGQSSAGAGDAFLRKYDASGTELWTRQFGSNQDDGGSSMAIDGNGNVYVAGYTKGALPEQTSVGSGDAFLRKYDGSGKVLWTRQFGSNMDDNASSVAVDGSGNVYVAGSTAGALPHQIGAANRDAFVRKYDPSGTELWTNQFGSGEYDGASSVAVDRNGDVYVAGTVGGTLPGQTSSGGRDPFVRKYDASGSALWMRQFGSVTHDSASAVTVDAGGNVYVAGTTYGVLPGQGTAGNIDAFVVKFDGSGKVQKTRQFGTDNMDGAASACLDDRGNIYVVGSTYGTLPNQGDSPKKADPNGISDAYVLRMSL